MNVSIKQYSQTLFDLTDGKSESEVSDMVKRFAEQLKADGQLKNVGKIMEKFAELYNTAHGIVAAQVVCHQELSASMLKEVKEFVKKKYDAKEVEIKMIVDEKIKGGIIIKVGDGVLDGSISAQLKKLQNILSK
ncbi:MAG: hypothetical protein ACD_11C00113G0002 [uncultured bacterium]|nr:MAG: hypothetical protein ACD_11C00113G0002 [uncultured bacterium]